MDLPTFEQHPQTGRWRWFVGRIRSHWRFKTKGEAKESALAHIFGHGDPAHIVSTPGQSPRGAVPSRLPATRDDSRFQTPTETKRERRCLGCGQTFESAGPHERLCGNCRKKSPGLI